jgi:hypothetical protein
MTHSMQAVLTKSHLYSALGRDHQLVWRPRYACWPRTNWEQAPNTGPTDESALC